MQRWQRRHARSDPAVSRISSSSRRRTSQQRPPCFIRSAGSPPTRLRNSTPAPVRCWFDEVYSPGFNSSQPASRLCRTDFRRHGAGTRADRQRVRTLAPGLVRTLTPAFGKPVRRCSARRPVMGRLAWHALLAVAKWPEIADRYIFNTRALAPTSPPMRNRRPATRARPARALFRTSGAIF